MGVPNVGFGMDGVWVALNNGSGGFQPAALVSGDLAYNTGWRVGNHPRFVTDLTGDGHADLLGFGDDGVWVALGNGDGTFAPARSSSPSSASTRAGASRSSPVPGRRQRRRPS